MNGAKEQHGIPKKYILKLIQYIARFDRYTNGFSIEDSDKFFFSLVKLIRPDKNLMDNVTARKIFNSLNMTVETLMERVSFSKMITSINSHLFIMHNDIEIFINQ